MYGEHCISAAYWSSKEFSCSLSGIRASRVIVHGPSSRDDLATIAEATDAALIIDGQRWTFGSSGPGTFRELKRRAEKLTR
jgi:hypothetical protein